MSIVFVPKRLRGKAKINQETIQRLLDENDQLVRCIADYMKKGRAVECVHSLVTHQLHHHHLWTSLDDQSLFPGPLPSTSCCGGMDGAFLSFKCVLFCKPDMNE
uniref:SS18 N-terminal domain-containing protein n=1 Tax=Gouania willdenowi TaxID=441366 RepID=A0A8C5DDT9_GOUWI